MVKMVGLVAEVHPLGQLDRGGQESLDRGMVAGRVWQQLRMAVEAVAVKGLLGQTQPGLLVVLEVMEKHTLFPA
jgi:hypothetical protein